MPMVAADHGASATILRPTSGATVGERGNVTFEYAGYHAVQAQGYLTLDGEWAGAFTALLRPPQLGVPTTINATLNATGSASGARQLGVHVYTANDTPVDAAPVAIVLDRAPSFTATATYDPDARALRVAMQVQDDGASAPVVRVAAGDQVRNASFTGAGEIVLPVAHRPGNYSANVSVTDDLGQAASAKIGYVVGDRAAEVDVLVARYEIGGRLVVRANVVEPDGGVSSAWVQTPLGVGDLQWANGTWSGDVQVRPALGTHTGRIVVQDAYGGESQHPFTFVIGGEREVLFERRVVTDVGAHGNIAMPFLPQVLNGTIEICVNACDPRVLYGNGGVVSVTIWEGAAVTGPQAPRACVSLSTARTCGFDIRNPGGWNADIVWAQMDRATITVRISGIRV